MAASKAQRIVTAKRRAQAVELKLAGLTFQQIADQLGYADRASACKDLDRALEQHVMERNRNVDLLIEEQLLVLLRMRRAFWPDAIKADKGAGEMVLKTTDRITKLLKLDPTLQVNLEITSVDAIDRQIEELGKQLRLEGAEYEWRDEPGAVQALPVGGVEAASGPLSAGPDGEAAQG
jgi:hypothetical protein